MSNMTLNELSKTSIGVSGWNWTIFEHILALGYITLFLLLISKGLKFKNADLKWILCISSILTSISFLMEIFLPVILTTLLGLPIMFLVSAALIKRLFNE